jgi:hypothetical protein
LGIFEILLFLVIALIVIPPDDLPQVMRAVGKVMRELRLASNTVMREISGAIGDDSPFNILPPRFDDPHPAPVPPTSPSPPPAGFLAPQPQTQPPPAASAPPPEAAPGPQTSTGNSRATGELNPVRHQAQAEAAPPDRPRSPGDPQPPSLPETSMPPAEKP